MSSRSPCRLWGWRVASLAQPSLAAPASDALDDSALRFLAAAAMTQRKEEE